MRKLCARISHRGPVWMDGVCITRTNQRLVVGILDLSAEGCRIALRGHGLSVSDPVAIKPEGLEALDANVVWVEEDQAGLHFERPLYGPVLDHFLRQHGLDHLPGHPNATRTQTPPRPLRFS